MVTPCVSPSPYEQFLPLPTAHFEMFSERLLHDSPSLPSPTYFNNLPLRNSLTGSKIHQEFMNWVEFRGSSESIQFFSSEIGQIVHSIKCIPSKASTKTQGERKILVYSGKFCVDIGIFCVDTRSGKLLCTQENFVYVDTKIRAHLLKLILCQPLNSK